MAVLDFTVGLTDAVHLAVASSVTAAAPACNAGDLLVMAALGSYTSSVTPQTPSGWTQRSSNGATLGVYTKTATSSEGPYTVSFSGTCAGQVIVASLPAGTFVSSFAASGTSVRTYTPTFPGGVGAEDEVLLIGAIIAPATFLGGPPGLNFPSTWTWEIPPVGSNAAFLFSTPYPSGTLGMASFRGPTSAPQLTSPARGQFFAGFLVLTVTQTPPPWIRVTTAATSLRGDASGLLGDQPACGMTMTVKALTGADAAATIAGQGASASSSGTPTKVTLTPTRAGSLIYGALTSLATAPSTYTPAAGTIFTQNIQQNYNRNDAATGTFQGSSPATAGTAVTAGASGPAAFAAQAAAAEILAQGTVAEVATATAAVRYPWELPGYASGTAVFTALPPAGSLLVASVAWETGNTPITSLTVSDSSGLDWTELVRAVLPNPHGIAAGGYAGVWVAQYGVQAGPPGVPTGLKVTAVTTTSVSLAWTAPAQGPVTGYDVYVNGLAVLSPATTTATVGNLSSGTTYSFTVDASNTHGKSAQTSAVQATTPGGVGNPGPTYIAIGDIPLAGMTVTATYYGALAGTPGGLYQISNCIQGGTRIVGGWCQDANGMGYDDNGVGAGGGKYASLPDQCTWAEDGSGGNIANGVLGTLPYGTKLEITYQGNVVYAEKGDISAGGVNSDGSRQVDFWWQTAKYLGMGTEPAQVFIRAVDPASVATTVPVPYNATDPTTYSAGATTPPRSPGGPPGRPAGPFVSWVTASSVSLTWDPPGVGSPATGYDVYVNGAKAKTVTTAFATVAGLTAATTYSFTVDAFNNAGTSGQTGVAQAATSSATPGSPVVQTAHGSTTGKTLTLTFPAVTAANHGVIVATMGYAGGTVSSIALGGGGTYTKQATSGGVNCEIWADLAITQTSATLTITTTTAGIIAYAYEVQSAPQAAGQFNGVWGLQNVTLDQSAGSHGASGTSWSSGATGTLAHAQEFVVGAGMTVTAGSITGPASGGWVNQNAITDVVGASTFGGVSGYQLSAGNAAFTYSGTTGTGGTWAGVTASFLLMPQGEVGWSGYIWQPETAPAGGYTGVTATFTIPSLTTPADTTHGFTIWVGLGNANPQTGVYCFYNTLKPGNNSLFLWSFFDPSSEQWDATTYPAQAGDSLTLSVTSDTEFFYMKMTNTTQSWAYTEQKSIQAVGEQSNSGLIVPKDTCEIIIEDEGGTGGVLPNYGSVTFTGITVTPTPLGNPVPWAFVNTNITQVPGPYSGGSFTMYWEAET